MQVKFKTTDVFNKYVKSIKNLNSINGHKVITELLKHDGVRKPRNLKVKECSVRDLKYKGRKIDYCSISSLANFYNNEGYISLNVI